MASTNKTTNYELSQYVGTDKPTYLGDYNSDMLKIDSAIHGVAENVGTETGRINIIENDIGTMANLTTSIKTDLVSAINEVDSNTKSNATNIGSLSSLNTTDKTSIVNAINEVNTEAKNIIGVELWSNVNVAIDFDPTTINIDLSEYDMFEVWYTHDKYKTTSYDCQLCIKGTNHMTFMGITSSEKISIQERPITFTDSNVQIGECTYYNLVGNSVVVQNLRNIPYKIIGYKTGLFN